MSRAGRPARKVLLVISDGGENSSRYTPAEVYNAIAETGVRVYAVGLEEASAAPALLAEIARRGGGLYLGIERRTDVAPRALELIAAMRRP